MKYLHYISSLLPVLLAALFLVVSDSAAQYYEFGKNRVQYEDQNWKYLQTRHFDIFFYEEDPVLSQFAGEAAEKAYERVAALIRHQIGRRIPILVYSDPRDFGVTRIVDLPFESQGIGGLTESFKNRIALPFSGNYTEFARILEHEIVHAVLNDMLFGGTLQSLMRSNFRIQLPLWFDEGLAEYTSRGWDSEADAFIRDAILTSSLPKLSDLDRFDAYVGGQSLWDYIASQYGHEKIAEVLAAVKQTRSVERAFRSTTGLSLDDLSDRWHRALREIHFPEVAARHHLENNARQITTSRGRYNAVPEISPRGDRVAYVTSDRGTFSIYVASTSGDPDEEKIATGNVTLDFESVRILSSGLSWNPSGDILAVAVSSGNSEAIITINIRTGRKHRIPVTQVDYIRSIDWSPDGGRIVLEGMRGGQTNLYVVDVTAESTEQVTHDEYGAHDPVWNPSGTHVVFHSYRPDRNAQTLRHAKAVARAEPNLFMLSIESGLIVQLTEAEGYGNRNPSFGSDPNTVIFESDRNGIFNLFELDITTGRERPLTNLLNGISQSSLSGDGSRAALVARNERQSVIYVLHLPFANSSEIPELVPTLWAHRRDAGLSGQSITVGIPGSSLSHANPFVRDAVDGIAFHESREPARMLASNSDDRVGLTPAGGLLGPDNPVVPLVQTGGDSTGSGVNIAFNTEGDAVLDFVNPAVPSNSLLVRDNIAADGSYRVRDYKLRFSPDLVYGTAGYDILYGVQGVTQMRVSDMIGNHRLIVTTNLLIDLRNSDYVVAYEYLATRLNWEYSIFQVSRLLPDFAGERPTYHRFRQSGAAVELSYPFNKFHRIDVRGSFVRGSQADITAARIPSQHRTFIYPSITFTRDLTTGGLLYPVAGRRLALSVAGSAGAIEGRQARFFTVLGDARSYFSSRSGSVTLALRGAAGSSVGTNPQLFYSSGVQNWINRGIDDTNGFPIRDAADFIFATPVLPARGFDVNDRNGSNFVLTNVEVRVPVASRTSIPLLNFVPVQNLTATGFADVGALWGGSLERRRLNIFGEDDVGNRVFDDLLVGTGGGLRSLIFGYPVRLDVAWPFDGKRFGQRQIYVSVGLDF